MKTKKKNEQWEHKHQGELAMKEVLFQLDQMLVNQSAQVKNGGQGPHQEDCTVHKTLAPSEQYMTNDVRTHA